MELIIALVLVVLIGAYFYSRSSKQEAQEAGVIALGEPPATVVVPVTESTMVVEGAGAVEIPAAPAKKATAKKPAAIKAKAPAKAPAKTAAKPKAAAAKKPRAPKAK